MDKEVKELINNLTQDIVELYDIQIPLQSIEAIVNKLGGHIEKSFEEGIKRQNGIFVIAVSKFQSAEGRTFTIAHELGHLFLHMGYRIDLNLWNQQKNGVYYSTNNILKEYQANEFAAAMLMSWKKYKEVLDKNIIGNKVDVSNIASHFGVSIFAASNRGKFLGYLQKERRY